MRLSELQGYLRSSDPVLTPLQGIRRLGVLARHERHFGSLARITRRREARQSFIAQIKSSAEPFKPGMHVYGHDTWIGLVVGVVMFSVDCDMTSGENKYLVPAAVQAVDEFMDKQLSCAEGRTTFRVCKPSEPFMYWSRDNALEAFEDGHPYTVCVGYGS